MTEVAAAPFLSHQSSSWTQKQLEVQVKKYSQTSQTVLKWCPLEGNMNKGSSKRNRSQNHGKGIIPKIVGEAWQIQTAKARFSEVFRLARSRGPQRITRQGQEGVVMISDEQYEQLVGKAHQPRSLVEFFRRSPLVGVDLDLQRSRDTERDLEL